MNAWKSNPAVRFWTRVVVVSVIGYVGTVFTTVAVDQFDAKAFLWGLGGAIFMGLGYALVGGTTPVEPFVGVGKVDNVQVPSPPAEPEEPELNDDPSYAARKHRPAAGKHHSA